MGENFQWWDICSWQIATKNEKFSASHALSLYDVALLCVLGQSHARCGGDSWDSHWPSGSFSKEESCFGTKHWAALFQHNVLPNNKGYQFCFMQRKIQIHHQQSVSQAVWNSCFNGNTFGYNHNNQPTFIIVNFSF